MVPFYQRYHGIDAAEVGSVIGLLMAVGGLVGVMLGGILADWLRRYTRRAKLYICLGAWALSLLAVITMLSVERVQIAYVCSFVYFLVNPMGNAPAMSTINDLAIPRTRAVVTAMLITTTTLTGYALGPYAVGLLSDTFVASGAESGEALRHGLLVGLVPQVMGIVCLLMAIKHIVVDEDSRLERARGLGEKI